MTQALASSSLTEGARPMHLRLGVFDVTVRSELAEVRDDLARLYRRQVIDHPAAGRRLQPVLDIRAVRQARRWVLDRRYAIRADGQVLFEDRRACEVLPYIEWAANWRIIAAHHQYLQIHGASLARGGRGLVLVGRSGAGKTTLAAGLLGRGWQYYCDEFALLETGRGDLCAYPKALCIKAGSFAVVRDLGLELYRRSAYVKAFKGPVGYVSPAQGWAAGPDDRCAVHAVCFVQYTGTARPGLEPVGGAEALMELSRQTFNRAELGQRGFELLAGLVRRARCFRLESGPVEPTCRLLESMMDQ